MSSEPIRLLSKRSISPGQLLRPCDSGKIRIVDPSLSIAPIAPWKIKRIAEIKPCLTLLKGITTKYGVHVNSQDNLSIPLWRRRRAMPNIKKGDWGLRFASCIKLALSGVSCWVFHYQGVWCACLCDYNTKDLICYTITDSKRHSIAYESTIGGFNRTYSNHKLRRARRNHTFCYWHVLLYTI